VNYEAIRITVQLIVLCSNHLITKCRIIHELLSGNAF